MLTPDHVHEDPALLALQVGADVLVEKPLAPTVESCRRLVAAAGDHMVGVGYNYRFIPVMAKAYQELRDGAIGDLVGISCFCHNFCWHHCLDLARWLAGPVVRVRAMEGRTLPDQPDATLAAVPLRLPTVMNAHPTIAVVGLEHAHGTISHITTTSQVDLVDVMFEMRLIGTDGWLRIDQVAIEDVVGRLRRFPPAHELSNVPPESRGELVEFFPSTTGGFPVSFEALIRAFHQAADTRTPPSATAAYGLEIVTIEAAARLSADEGRAVQLAEIA